MQDTNTSVFEELESYAPVADPESVFRRVAFQLPKIADAGSGKSLDRRKQLDGTRRELEGEALLYFVESQIGTRILAGFGNC